MTLCWIRTGSVYRAWFGMNVAAMEITLTKVKVDGNQADATVSFAAKGTAGAQMTMQYHLEQKDNKWTVVGRQDASQHTNAVPAPTGDNPHGGAAPGADNPHGGGMPAPSAGGAAPAAGSKMPAPEDLPPLEESPQPRPLQQMPHADESPARDEWDFLKPEAVPAARTAVRTRSTDQAPAPGFLFVGSPAAFLSRTLVGGVFRTMLKERSE